MLECQQPSRHKITTRYCCRRKEGLGFLGSYSQLWARLSRGSFTRCCGAAWLSQEGKPAKNVLFLFLKMLPGLSLPQHSCCIEFILSQLLQLGECLRDAAGASRAALRREMVEKQPAGRFFWSPHLKKPRCSGVSGGNSARWRLLAGAGVVWRDGEGCKAFPVRGASFLRRRRLTFGGTRLAGLNGGAVTKQSQKEKQGEGDATSSTDPSLSPAWHMGPAVPTPNLLGFRNRACLFVFSLFFNLIRAQWTL